MKILLFFTLIFLSFAVFAQDLPKGLTPAEAEMMKSYIFPSSPDAFTNPPNMPVRTMAEWETLDGILVTWTSYLPILRQTVDFAQDECTVYIVCSDSNSVKTYLTSGGVPLINLKFIIAPFNSIWVRDYGPWTVYGNFVDSLLLIDWVYNRPRPSDDVIPQAFANYYNAPLYQTLVEPYKLVATGGNFMTDGLGNAFSSKLILTDNAGKTEAQINSIMASFMGITNYIKLTSLPYDGIHHIDMHMKLLDEETILVGQYPNGISDGPQIELNLQYILNNFLTPFGRPYKIIRIPMPPDANNQYPSQGGDYRTFTNSVFVNKTVIVPTYDPKYDTTALRIYREALPGYRIVAVNSNNIIPASGAIHCITKEIGVKDQIFLSHNPMPARKAIPGQGFQVKAFVRSKLPLTDVRLYYTTDTTAGWQQTVMLPMSADSIFANIPEFPLGTKTFYYFTASTASRTISKPMTSPKSCYSFIADGILPVELASFDLFSQNGDVVLKWVTISELNNKEFLLERKQEGSDWQEVARVTGKGTSTSTTSYSYTDKNIGQGVFFYRLVQVDFDGTTKFYDKAEVTVESFDYFLYQNYPNPFNPSTVIFFNLKKEGFVNLSIYNSIGEKVAEPLNEMLQNGIHKVEFNASNLPAGVYIYKLSAGEFNCVKKMLLIK
jgi:agmatine/peptidylarginine deiminase